MTRVNTCLLTLVIASGCYTDFTIPPPVPLVCNPEPYDGVPELYPTCDLGICGEGEAARERGRCVDDADLEADQIAILAPCGDGVSHCVPTNVLRFLGKAQPQACSSVRGFEGRCTSLCIPAVQENAAILPKDTCADGELCVPCHDPLTGESTGACESNECDMPVNPPQTFQHCCANPDMPAELLGVCLPTSLIPDDKEGSIERKECALADDLCVPSENTDPAYVAPRCSNALGDPGACISICVPDANNVLFEDSECPPHTNCVPCTIPIAGDTGACS